MNKMTETEIITRDFLFSNSNLVMHSTIEELSEIVHVSPATIIRTLKKQGFKGFSDYKNELIRRNLNNLEDFSFEIAEVISKNLEEVEKTIELLTVEEIEIAVEKIHKSSRVFIFSTGTTTSVADYIVRKFQLIGLFVINIQDDDLIVHYSTQLKKDECAIYLSQSGETKCIIQGASNAFENNASIISITTNRSSRLSNFSDVTLLSYKSPLKKIMSPIESASRFSLEMTARILTDSYIIYCQGKSIKKSK